MLDEISRSLPEMLWLTEIKQQGNELTIDGRCTTLTALSDFVGNLELGGFFKKPVEILDSQVDQTRTPGGVDLIRFSIKAVIDTPGGGQSARSGKPGGERRVVAVTLTKLPWYGQIGAFLALSVAGVGVFY